MPRLSRIDVAVAVLVIGLSTSGCTRAVTTPEGDDGWSSRMTGLLSDPQGGGGAGGEIQTPDGDGDASDDPVVTLGSVPEGAYDVLGVCRNGAVVHLSVTEFAEEGPDWDPDSVLAESDIACGATARLPLTTRGMDIAIKASGPAGAEWQASLVSPDWEPTPTDFG